MPNRRVREEERRKKREEPEVEVFNKSCLEIFTPFVYRHQPLLSHHEATEHLVLDRGLHFSISGSSLVSHFFLSLNFDLELSFPDIQL